MTATRPATTRLLSRILGVGSLLSVLILTLIDRGATRAYATPWIYLFWFAHVAPLLALSLRALPSSPRLQLPSRSWCMLIAVSASAVLLSALASPYRGSSLLAALTPLAGLAAFLLIHDAAQTSIERCRDFMLRWLSYACLVILVVSLGRWAVGIVGAGTYRSLGELVSHRNDFPLGHPHYTAGLALLIMPWFGYRAWRTAHLARAGWIVALLLALIMLVTSGGRGGLIGGASLAVLALVNARVHRRTLVLLSLLALTAVAALAYAHPRSRAFLTGFRAQSSALATSDTHRALTTAGWSIGRERPLFGWGAGSTPLVYPRFRATLEAGVENTLQLHSTPVQLWAEFGFVGVTCLLGFAFLMGRERQAGGLPRQPLSTPAFLSLASYGAFALTDAQLDVPIFTLAVATCAALMAGPHPQTASSLALEVGRTLRVSRDRTRLGGDASPYLSSASFRLGISALLVLLLVGFFGHRDPTPELNLRALALADNPARTSEAIDLLNRSLALNPDQEIAQFNLGWLLLVHDPVGAAKQFEAAAHLVPHRGGVYLGLALARLAQQPTDEKGAIDALALECLNDAEFLISPRWRQPELNRYRDATLTTLHRFTGIVASRLPKNPPAQREANYISALAEWLEGRSSIGEMLRVSFTPGRVTYFAARPTVPPWQSAKVNTYHRERSDYPGLMRNPDLPTPVDLYTTQQNSLATTELAGFFPSKSWLPAPVLIELLDGAASRK
ncbi:MAG: O-antigen ligase family protein [Opitutus sp.]